LQRRRLRSGANRSGIITSQGWRNCRAASFHIRRGFRSTSACNRMTWLGVRHRRRTGARTGRHPWWPTLSLHIVFRKINYGKWWWLFLTK
jgi:hypothetical protein